MPAGGILFHGGDGDDSVRVIGTSAGDTFSASHSQVLFGTSRIDLDGVERERIDGNGGDDTLILTAPFVDVPVFNVTGASTLKLQAGAYDIDRDLGSDAPGLDVVAGPGAVAPGFSGS